MQTWHLRSRGSGSGSSLRLIKRILVDIGNFPCAFLAFGVVPVFAPFARGIFLPWLIRQSALYRKGTQPSVEFQTRWPLRRGVRIPQPESSIPRASPIESPWSAHCSNKRDPPHCALPATMKLVPLGHPWDSLLNCGGGRKRREKGREVQRVSKAVMFACVCILLPYRILSP